MSTPPPIAAATDRLLEDAAERRTAGLTSRERIVEGTFALVSVGAVIAFSLLATPERAFDIPLALLFVIVYAVVARVEFMLGDGFIVPTQIVVVPMLLLLPTPVVPLLIMLAALTITGVNVLRGRTAAGRAVLAITDGAFALAPAVVLVALDAETPAWSHWPAYVAAIAAQFAADYARDTARAKLGGRACPRQVAQETFAAHRVDVLLAPVGLVAAIAAAETPAAALLVLPVIAILAVFSREREARVAQSFELGRAYRGTALLLRDLLEEDDEYTGHHTEDVVDLSVKVADRLNVSDVVKRDTEMGALLHDIGKIAIPDRIINKPGPLDAEEWAIMQTHTVVGQQMLDRVGGLLSGVGLVVRASHERFDGRGYPDGLTGCEIPLAARIIIACDSFNAMTTDRPYRKALPISEAVAELHRCSGTQFDPNVVEALLAVVGDPGWQLTVREPTRVAASVGV